MSLTEFLLARIAEDEAVAKAAHEHWPGPWTYDRRGGEVHHSGEGPWGYDRPYVCNADGHLADEHIARQDPARVMARCESDRKIVEEAQRVAVATHQEMGSLSDLADHVLTHLALPYADHPDYRPEWKP